jgi:peptidyl-tRNA hydrolase, PTH1 family
MYIIAGLGNPGKEYENTRHNIGFDVIDRLAEEENIAVMESKHKALIGKGYVAGQKVILAKPQTFMNLSGESIREIVDYYKVDDTSELIVISDDISLDVGQIRIRKKGSAGGHNGLKNIIKMLGHDTFTRVRMGVGEKPILCLVFSYSLPGFPSPAIIYIYFSLLSCNQCVILYFRIFTQKMQLLDILTQGLTFPRLLLY